MKILVDSNVLLDVFTRDPEWLDWSCGMISRYAEDHILAINPVIYAEVSINFRNENELEAALPAESFARLPLPWEAAFTAGRAFLKYRRQGGVHDAPLPDFYIGAHAWVGRLPLLTRDKGRYKTYFPRLELISP